MSQAEVKFANADQALIHRFLQGDGSPLPIDSNPFARALRSELWVVDENQQQVAIEFDPDPLFIQGTGVLQGGAVSAMLDFAMAFAVLARVPIGVSCATVTMTSNFLRAAPKGRYRAIGAIERCGKTLAFAHARLNRCDENETLIATASSTLALA